MGRGAAAGAEQGGQQVHEELWTIVMFMHSLCRFAIQFTARPVQLEIVLSSCPKFAT